VTVPVEPHEFEPGAWLQIRSPTDGRRYELRCCSACGEVFTSNAHLSFLIGRPVGPVAWRMRIEEQIALQVIRPDNVIRGIPVV
jgi:hypothetical protein